MPPASPPDMLNTVFPGDSRMAALMRAHDWSATPLGPAEAWPETLQIPLRMMLDCRFEMWLGWGPDLAFFYNDAYAPTLGEKHPAALGRPMREVWREVFEAVEDRVLSVMRDGRPTWDEALLLLLERAGYREETYHTFSYSPLRGVSGAIDGLICVVSEVTEQVISARRLETLRTLATALLPARSRQAVREGAMAALRESQRSFPFATLRLFDDTPLPAQSACGGSDPLAQAPWPFDGILAGAESLCVDLAGILDDPPSGPWDTKPSRALIVPITKTGRAVPSGALVLGLNPFRRLGAATMEVARLLAGQIAGVLATVDAHLDEAAERERLRQLFAQSPNFIAVLRGPEHRFELINPAFVQLAGGRSLIGQTALDAAPELEQQGFIALLDRVYRSGEPYVGYAEPIRMLPAPGTAAVGAMDERTLDFVLQPMRDDGATTGIFIAGIDVTAGHDAILRLRESEAQFRTFAQVMPNQVWTSPPDGLLDWFNDRVFAYSGRDADSLRGTGWTDLVHPEDLGRASAAWAQSLASGAQYEIEFRIRRHDGAYRWHLVRALPLRDPAGKLKRWVGTNTDIHERRIIDARNERDLIRIWSLSPVLKLVASLNGDIIAVNPSWVATLGWEETETVGRNIAEFIVDEKSDPLDTVSPGFADAPGAQNFRCNFVTRAGEHRCIEWTTVPEDGNLYAFGRDITAELEADRALAASMSEKERIWNSTNDLMGTAAHDGTLKSVNPAWNRLLGYTEAELLSGMFLDLVAPESHAKVIEAIAGIASGAPVRDMENRVIHKDGTISLLSWSAEPAGELFYIVGRDITEQRAAEDALRQSQKMEAVGQLTGGIAHDFNNLLQGITGSLDLVRKRLAQGRLGDVDRFIHGAMSSAARASALTHRLLAFSRRQPLDPRPVQANPLVASMEDLLRRTLGERIELELMLADDLWLTLCDPNQLENAVLNLAINARDAMQDGGRLTIETCNADLDNAYAAHLREVKPGQYVCISVTDTGIGMDAVTIERAFEPFFTTKPIGQGTGLGLSMIYGFARQSEGHAKIYSEPGRGTNFRLYLPRYRGPVENRQQAVAPGDARSAGADETVLVVEDEAVVRGLIVEVLVDLGYTAIEATDGPAGLAILQSARRVDLLITDIGLPGLNGRQMAEAARIARPGLRVLFMTGYAENAALAAGFLEPGMAMMAKPFAMQALAGRIREILEDGPARG